MVRTLRLCEADVTLTHTAQTDVEFRMANQVFDEMNVQYWQGKLSNYQVATSATDTTTPVKVMIDWRQPFCWDSKVKGSTSEWVATLNLSTGSIESSAEGGEQSYITVQRPSSTGMRVSFVDTNDNSLNSVVDPDLVLEFEFRPVYINQEYPKIVGETVVSAYR